MVLFKLEMIQANTKLFFTEKKNHTNKSNTIKLPWILYTINQPKTLNKNLKTQSINISNTLNTFQVLILIVLLVLNG